MVELGLVLFLQFVLFLDGRKVQYIDIDLSLVSHFVPFAFQAEMYNVFLTVPDYNVFTYEMSKYACITDTDRCNLSFSI